MPKIWLSNGLSCMLILLKLIESIVQWQKFQHCIDFISNDLVLLMEHKQTCCTVLIS